MISRIEALNYRCLQYVDQPLAPFHVLVGPNASGKTTFLDVIAFLSDFVSQGLDAAIQQRSANFQDLLWKRSGSRLELAVEARIPKDRRDLLANPKYDTIRYEVALESDPDSSETFIAAEKGILKQFDEPISPERLLFPLSKTPPPTILSPSRSQNTRTLFSKTDGGNDNYHADAHRNEGRWAPSFKLGPRKSTLGNLPEDESNFPVSTWLKDLISVGVEQIVLNSLHIRKASPPGKGTGFLPDGSNIPWVVYELEQKAPERLQEWVDHLRTALPDLLSVRSVLRPDDHYRYLMLQYEGGLEVPSWVVSDGTLRLMALTLPAYLEGVRRVFLVEEPENGIHPRAVETMYDSLSSVYDAQVLLTTHSPVVLSVAPTNHVLCFGKNEQGATDIIIGDQHPRLDDWHGEVDLGTLFASGVLG